MTYQAWQCETCGEPFRAHVGSDHKPVSTRREQVRTMLAEGKTRRQISDELGVSRQRVGQIVAKIRDGA